MIPSRNKLFRVQNLCGARYQAEVILAISRDVRQEEAKGRRRVPYLPALYLETEHVVELRLEVHPIVARS